MEPRASPEKKSIFREPIVVVAIIGLIGTVITAIVGPYVVGKLASPTPTPVMATAVIDTVAISLPHIFNLSAANRMQSSCSPKQRIGRLWPSSLLTSTSLDGWKMTLSPAAWRPVTGSKPVNTFCASRDWYPRPAAGATRRRSIPFRIFMQAYWYGASTTLKIFGPG